MSRLPRHDSVPEGTRAALIAAGIHFFGQQGFAATSTREVAARARTNVASISYHFGGKDGLRRACGEDFARRLTGVMTGTSSTPVTNAEDARRELHAAFARVVAFLLSAGDASEGAAFLLRELTEDSPGIEPIYVGFMEPAHKHLCRLWGLVRGQVAESVEVRLSVFSLIGQILYFRIGSSIVARRMGWAAVGPEQIDLITATLLGNLDALLEAPGKV